MHPIRNPDPPTATEHRACHICFGSFQGRFVRISCGHEFHASCHEMQIREKAIQDRLCKRCKTLITKFTDENRDTYEHDCFPDLLFITACATNNAQKVKEMLKYGININARNIGHKATALTLAAENGYKEIVKILIDAEANVHIDANNGCTPLTQACQNGHIEIVKMLIDAGADVNTVTNTRCSPLMVACEKGHADIALELIKNQASIDVANNDAWLHSPNSGMPERAHKDCK